MKRSLVLLLAAFLGLPVLAQEVAIFKDHRSLVIQSHRETAGWTYLKVSGGELAVRTSDLLTIVTEKGARPPAAPLPAVSPSPAAPSPAFPRPAFVQERPAPPPPPPPEPEEDVGAEEGGADEEEVDDTEAEAEAAATKPPDQPPKPGADQKPLPPPGFARPNINLDNPIPINQKDKED